MNGSNPNQETILNRCHCFSLYDIHAGLCHPGITRTYHFVKSKNLPYSLHDVRKVVNACKTCAEIKPKFFKPTESHLIKATQPMERLSIDFKGPLPSASKNKYLLTVIDEFSRYPFAFPCGNMESQTVISCLMQIFNLFGACAYIHSDRGKSFLSKEFVSYMNNLRIPTSKTSVYNPTSNGQCEKYNDIIWSGVKLALKERNLPILKWEVVLPQVLHSIRSLLCTATNTTCHERFLNFSRCSVLGISVPSWLNSPGTILIRRHVRQSKYDPLVEEADLIHATPQYAHIRYKNGRETTVSLKDVAPLSGPESPQLSIPTMEESNPCTDESIPEDDLAPNVKAVQNGLDTSQLETSKSDEDSLARRDATVHDAQQDVQVHDTKQDVQENFEQHRPLRRSNRTRKPPERLVYYH